MNNFLDIINHDAFRYGIGLNKSAGEAYWFLMQNPLTAKEICTMTGRGKTTIYRALNAMSNLVDSRTGEVLSMVHKQNGVWSANLDISLDQIALIIGTAGIGKLKAKQYRKEQRDHRRTLRQNREKKQPLTDK